MLDKIVNNISYGSSVIPVIIIHTLLLVIQPYLWPGISINKLKEHTSVDKHSNSYGDIQGIDSNIKTKIAIEVKHKISINDSIIDIFNKKMCIEDIPLKFIITTANISKRIVKNNICIDTLTNFILSYLQQTLFYEKKICLIFTERLRLQLVEYNNVSIESKKLCNEIITSHLVVSSL